MTVILRRQYSVFFKYRTLLPCGVKYVKGQIFDSGTTYFTEVSCIISQSIQVQ